MALNVLSLPIDVPWKLIAVSPDMMDTQFCNKLFPFAWRSSLAISAFEPERDDLPEELCEERITYLKITSTITGYQPSEEETKRGYTSFPNVPTEDLDRILSEYFACYGVLLNVAVFPYGDTIRESQQVCVDFGQQRPDTILSNPYQSDQVGFQATGQQDNRIVDLYPQGGDQSGELDLHREMVVTFPVTSHVEAKIVHHAAPVTMEAYQGDQLVRSQVTGPEQGQVHDLSIEAEGIDRVVFTTPENEASLLRFCYDAEEERRIGLEDYPHIIDFEPKMRDLYQGATENGEILTASISRANTGKTMAHTESSETGLNLGAKYTTPELKYGRAEVTGGLSHKWGQTDQDTSTTQTEGSRDRRELQGTTTNLSQMYNLLTGYHPGTNRASFLMLPRPHMLQPTDRRTFIQGLRYIEGVQEFFLIVARPEGMEGLCVEAFLETGHFPEDVDIEEPLVEYDEAFEDFIVKAQANGGSPPTFFFGAETKNVQDFQGASHPVATGWVIDKRLTRIGPDAGHPGIMETANRSNSQSDASIATTYNYQAISDSEVQVSGTISGRNNSIIWVPTGVAGISAPGGILPSEPAIFDRSYRVFTRSEQPKSTKPGTVTTKFFTTSRGLCACLKSGDGCPETVSIERPSNDLTHGDMIVNESVIEVDSALLTSDVTEQSRLPAMKEALRKIQFNMTTSWRLRTRLPFGEVGFLESDYFKDRIKAYLPEEALETPLRDVSDLPGRVVESLRGDSTVKEVLEMDLPSFAEAIGSSISDAAATRRRLLEIVQEPSGEEDGGPERHGSE